jgi:hypothetical protein
VPVEAAAPTTQPGTVVPEVDVALDGVFPTEAARPTDGPTTQPAVVTLSPDIEFDRLEAEIRRAAKLPIEQQPIPELLAGYRKVAAAPELPESMRRIAEHRVQTLEVHNQNRELILAHQRDQADKESKRLALRAEQEELMERMKNTGIVFYAAVGTLRPSNLQMPSPDGGTLYRLTDPMTGRTVMYIRSADVNTSRMVGLFVGVQGEVTSDEAMQLRYIAPSEIEPVDQRNVNRSVAARIVPPSLMPGGALAETGTGEVNR